MKGFGLDHNYEFKELCFEINAPLSDEYAKEKYKNLKYNGIETPYK